MVRQSYTAVVERAEGLTGDFTSEPYETGWASEAIVFVKLLRLDSGAVEAGMQKSPDGIDWADESTSFDTMDEPGLYFVKLSNFGGWLRVTGEVRNSEAGADFPVYISLKE